MKVVLAAMLVAGLALAACGDGDDDEPALRTVAATATRSGPLPTPAPTNTPSTGNAEGIPQLDGEIVTTDSGLRYIDEVVGTGPTPDGPSAQVTVHYTGWLTDGTEFDSSIGGDPVPLQLDMVIPGWTEGVGSMNVGGKRRLLVPSDLAYGETGRGSIPPNAELIFDVELISSP
jgi:peptidylprolyl isomerase